jgi:hypothetical protein
MNVISYFRSRTAAVLASGAFAAVVGLQFVRPELKNPPVVANVNVPPHVEQVLRHACYDCHSNETKLAWFDEIVPAYWLVASDVKDGRSRLNFSELGQQPAAQQNAALFEAVNQIVLGAMPPDNYRLLHPEANLSSEDVEVLKSYLESLEVHGPSPSPAVVAADEQYVQWVGDSAGSFNVHPASNGIEFPADYKSWRAISSTERMDNHTMREVLGNDVAIDAIKTGRVSPWPDGTMFAKVAWDELAGDQGSVQPGQFKQVEFMIKDSRKYASTAGWGWARWVGMDLQPFGKTSDFTTSCVSCHTPMRSNDFVFTTPLRSEF